MPPFRIELRSDTQTVPTADMRAAMAEAEVGDDQAREDPTVRRLEDMAAEMSVSYTHLTLPTNREV